MLKVSIFLFDNLSSLMSIISRFIFLSTQGIHNKVFTKGDVSFLQFLREDCDELPKYLGVKGHRIFHCENLRLGYASSKHTALVNNDRMGKITSCTKVQEVLLYCCSMLYVAVVCCIAVSFQKLSRLLKFWKTGSRFICSIHFDFQFYDNEFWY